MECPFCIGVSGGWAGANDLRLFREDGSSFPNGGEIDSRAVASWPLRFRAGPLAPAAEFAARVLGEADSVTGEKAADTIHGRVVNVDLDVEADGEPGVTDADEPKEEDPGGYACVCTNNLTPIKLKLEPGGLPGKVTLSATAGGSRIRVWQDAGRAAEVPLTTGAVWNAGAAIPGTLYVEGVAPSAALRDVALRLEYDENPAGQDNALFKCADVVRLTVLKVDLDIDGLSETDEDTVGGLVVRNHDGNNAPRKKITIQKVDPNAWSGNVILTRTATKAKVFTASSGGSEITFNGTDNKFANATLPKDLYVEGNEQSALMCDIQIKAEAEGVSGCEDPVSFTVLWVDMAAGKHSGTMSSDNAATNSYYSFYTVNPNRLDLGPGEFSDRFGISTEFRGDVFPTNFAPSEFGMTMNLSRTKDVYSYYSNPSTNGSDVYYHSTGDDTGPTSARDDDPQSGESAGKIYDFDNPGIPKNQPGDAVGHIRRYRGNFHEFANAVVGGVTTRCSSTMDWYSKQSWQKGTNTWSQINDVANDNANGDGQLTSQTWNMQ